MHGLATRTTGSLEAQNGVLGKILMKRGSFYKFVAYLLDHEYSKAREFVLLIDSGGMTGPERKKKNRVNMRSYAYFGLVNLKDRAQKIAESTAQLDKGEIDPAIFPTRIVCKQNGMCPTNLDDFSHVDSIYESDSADETGK